MANKILKTLTIDGVSRDMHDVVLQSDYKTDQTLPTVNTFKDLITFQLTTPGVYIFSGIVGFTSVGSTADVLREIRISTSNSYDHATQKIHVAGNTAPYLSAASFYILQPSEGSISLILKARCGQSATGINAFLKVAKIIDL